MDDCSLEYPGQIVDMSISGERFARFLDDLAGCRGLSESPVMDNVLNASAIGDARRQPSLRIVQAILL